jgi:hypothetical protein
MEGMNCLHFRGHEAKMVLPKQIERCPIMPILFDCPHCQVGLEIAEDRAGTEVACLGCGAPIRVPLSPFQEACEPRAPVNWFPGAALVFAGVMVGVWLIMRSSAILLGVLFLLAAYFAPSIVAVSRKHQNAPAIAALNLFLGWTFIGWLVAFVWSLTQVRSTAEQHYHHHYYNHPG